MNNLKVRKKIYKGTKGIKIKNTIIIINYR